jgi:Glycosyl-transferase for dystroglycan
MAGHKPTDYKQWFHAMAPYPIQYQTGYEPYLLIDRRLMPLYDERFRGYGTAHRPWRVCPVPVTMMLNDVPPLMPAHEARPGS